MLRTYLHRDENEFGITSELCGAGWLVRFYLADQDSNLCKFYWCQFYWFVLSHFYSVGGATNCSRGSVDF